jgi:hypothetical protein
VLYFRDDDFFDGFGAHLQVHLEEVVGVELVIDQQGVALGDCVDQRRFFGDLEGSDPDSAHV